MRDDWDGRYKELVAAALEGTGEVLQGLESGATTQRMDVVFRPDAEHRAERLRRGLLGLIVDACECDLEPFRNTPSLVRVRDCVRRVWNYHHARTAAKAEAGEAGGASTVAAMTRVVVLSPGRPREAMAVFGLRRHPTLSRGVYTTHPAIGLWVVVIAELPTTRATLALRLLGRRQVLAKALSELAALPPEAWEHKLLEILLRWGQAVEASGPRSQEDEEFMEITRETFEQFKDRLRHEGERANQQHSLLRLFARRLGRSLSADEQATLVQRLDSVGPDRLGDVVLDLSPAELATWLADPDAR